MKKRMSPWSCLFAVLALLVFLIIAGAAWWYFGLRSQNSAAPPPSPLFVTLLSPSNADEIPAGDFVPVTLKAVAPEGIQSAELFVDGKSLGVLTDSPESAAWVWQAWPVGIHSLLAKVTTTGGQVGQSQSLLVNVLVGDGLMQIPASEGQTLAQIGAAFEVPADPMAVANPHVDPDQPLADGQPVQVPVASGSPTGSDPGLLNFQILPILWQFKSSQPVEKSYCYTSSGDGTWEKIPKEPFDFFPGPENTYLMTDMVFSAQVNVIQMQCWGWMNGILISLGQGGTSFDILQPADHLEISGQGFHFDGIPQFPIPIENFTKIGDKTIPPPFALREPMDAADCTNHSHPLVAPFICNTLMNAQVKQHILLEWEWQPETLCWPGTCKYGVDAIAGYRIYEIDPFTKAEKYLKEVTNPTQKLTAIPLPWGPHCYGVRAFVDDPAIPYSDMVSYCPGDVPVPKKVTLNPSEWITTGGQWVESGDCDTYGGKDNYAYYNENNGFGNSAGQVLVGSYIVDDDDEDCYKEGNYSGGVRFSLQQNLLPAGATIHNAQLKFSSSFVDYGATAYASPKPVTCVAGIGYSKLDWGGLVGANHFSSKNLSSTTYFIPIASLGEFQSPSINVTYAVNTWVKYPDKNHGFILTPAAAPHPYADGQGRCLSGLGNFVLEIEYFAP